MNSLVAQQQGYSFPMDEIPRTYYPGRGFLTDQQAYPENPFARSPRYSGGAGVPGAPGNLMAADKYIRGNFAPPNSIIRAPHIDSPYLDEQIRRGFVPMTPPPARPPGPQLFPLAAVGEDQQPAQGPNTPIKYYPGMGYGPYGPGNGGMVPTPVRQAQGVPAGFQNKYVS